jgi:hypothetical protein
MKDPRALGAVLLAIMLGGCSFMAPRVEMPKMGPADEVDPAKKYPVNSKYLALPHETDIRMITQQMRAYAGTWADARDTLNQWNFVSGEGIFYGGITAAIGGIVNSPHTAIVGTALAGGASLLTNHYALKIQATNYGNASDAMQCLYNSVTDVSPAIWNLYDLGGNLIPPKSDFSGPALAGYDTLVVLIPTINDSMNKVVAALAKAQASVTLVTPSVADITQAISVAAKSKQASDGISAPVAIALASSARVKTLSGGPISLPDAAVALALQLPATLQKCNAAFGP